MTTIDSQPALDALEQRATRFETAGAGAAMVWRVWGAATPGRPPIVLLHGGSGSWTHWLRNIDALVDQGRQVWVPDLPGFGESARPASGGDADALVAPVEAGLRERLGDVACDLAGFSFGAIVGTLLAVAHPRRVERLVLVGAPALGIAPNPPILLRAWAGQTSRAKREAAIRANLAALMLSRRESIDAFTLALQEHNVLRDRMRRRRLARGDSIARALPTLAVPVHGIWGEFDALYAGQTDRIEPALRAAPRFGSLQLIAGAGHWVQYEVAPAFDAALAIALQDR